MLWYQTPKDVRCANYWYADYKVIAMQYVGNSLELKIGSCIPITCSVCTGLTCLSRQRRLVRKYEGNCKKRRPVVVENWWHALFALYSLAFQWRLVQKYEGNCKKKKKTGSSCISITCSVCADITCLSVEAGAEIQRQLKKRQVVSLKPINIHWGLLFVIFSTLHHGRINNPPCILVITISYVTLKLWVCTRTHL
jgi:hypothetical protein